MNVINKMFGWKDHADRTRKLAYAITHPIAPIVVDQKDAPVQEEVYEKPAEANDYVVPIRHTHIEPELTVGSGNRLISGEYFNGGTDLGYNRMNFRWGNVGTFQISPGSHMWQVVSKYYKDNKVVPITMNFGLPPAGSLLAGAGFDYVILPQGCDEVGIAGAVQGAPMRLVKARTVPPVRSSSHRCEGPPALCRSNAIHLASGLKEGRRARRTASSAMRIDGPAGTPSRCSDARSLRMNRRSRPNRSPISLAGRDQFSELKEKIVR